MKADLAKDNWKTPADLIPTRFEMPEAIKKRCKGCGEEFEAFVQDHCDSCFERLRKAQEAREREDRIRCRLDSFWNMVPEEFKNTDLSRVPNPSKAKEALAHDWTGDKSMLIHGVSGSAKTRVAILCLEKAIKQGRTVEFVDEFRLHAIALKPYDNDDWLKRACYSGVTLLDDLGNQPITEAVEFVVWQIIKTRKNELLPTIITTQYRGEGLLDRFRSRERGMAILRRLEESCVEVNFNG